MEALAVHTQGNHGKKKSFGAYMRRYWFLYMLVVPGLIALIVFSYGPMYGILLAFKDYNFKLGIIGSPWAAPFFKNFEFFTDGYFWQVIRNTLLINVYNVVFGFTFTVFLALMINEMRLKRTQKLVQTAVYLPYFLSWVIFAGLVIVFLDIDKGMINNAIQLFGGEPINFLADKRYFRGILVISNTIKSAGYNTIIYLAALAGVNPELYESARVDGANRFHLIWHISLPRILPTVAVLLILQLSSLFISNFDQVYNLYNPMVYETGDVISTYIYRIGMEKSQYTSSTAINLVFNLMGLGIIVGSNKIVEKFDVMGIF